MKRSKKTPIDLIDDLYSLAYWMTGTEEETRELVDSTYLQVDDPTEEMLILKAFRACYAGRYGQQTGFCIDEKACRPQEKLTGTLSQWTADIKLSVLLSEISGLKHQDIAEIVQKPVDTIRTWLFFGRKFLVSDMQLKASA